MELWDIDMESSDRDEEWDSQSSFSDEYTSSSASSDSSEESDDDWPKIYQVRKNTTLENNTEAGDKNFDTLEQFKKYQRDRYRNPDAENRWELDEIFLTEFNIEYAKDCSITNKEYGISMARNWNRSWSNVWVFPSDPLTHKDDFSPAPYMANPYQMFTIEGYPHHVDNTEFYLDKRDDGEVPEGSTAISPIEYLYMAPRDLPILDNDSNIDWISSEDDEKTDINRLRSILKPRRSSTEIDNRHKHKKIRVKRSKKKRNGVRFHLLDGDGEKYIARPIDKFHLKSSPIDKLFEDSDTAEEEEGEEEEEESEDENEQQNFSDSSSGLYDSDEMFDRALSIIDRKHEIDTDKPYHFIDWLKDFQVEGDWLCPEVNMSISRRQEYFLKLELGEDPENVEYMRQYKSFLMYKLSILKKIFKDNEEDLKFADNNYEMLLMIRAGVILNKGFHFIEFKDTWKEVTETIAKHWNITYNANTVRSHYLKYMYLFDLLQAWKIDQDEYPIFEKFDCSMIKQMKSLVLYTDPYPPYDFYEGLILKPEWKHVTHLLNLAPGLIGWWKQILWGIDDRDKVSVAVQRKVKQQSLYKNISTEHNSFTLDELYSGMLESLYRNVIVSQLKFPLYNKYDWITEIFEFFPKEILPWNQYMNLSCVKISGISYPELLFTEAEFIKEWQTPYLGLSDFYINISDTPVCFVIIKPNEDSWRFENQFNVAAEENLDESSNSNSEEDVMKKLKLKHLTPYTYIVPGYFATQNWEVRITQLWKYEMLYIEREYFYQYYTPKPQNKRHSMMIHWACPTFSRFEISSFLTLCYEKNSMIPEIVISPIDVFHSFLTNFDSQMPNSLRTEITAVLSSYYDKEKRQKEEFLAKFFPELSEWSSSSDNSDSSSETSNSYSSNGAISSDESSRTLNSYSSNGTNNSSSTSRIRNSDPSNEAKNSDPSNNARNSDQSSEGSSSSDLSESSSPDSSPCSDSEYSDSSDNCSSISSDPPLETDSIPAIVYPTFYEFGIEPISEDEPGDSEANLPDTQTSSPPDSQSSSPPDVEMVPNSKTEIVPSSELEIIPSPDIEMVPSSEIEMDPSSDPTSDTDPSFSPPQDDEPSVPLNPDSLTPPDSFTDSPHTPNCVPNPHSPPNPTDPTPPLTATSQIPPNLDLEPIKRDPYKGMSTFSPLAVARPPTRCDHCQAWVALYLVCVKYDPSLLRSDACSDQGEGEQDDQGEGDIGEGDIGEEDIGEGEEDTNNSNSDSSSNSSSEDEYWLNLCWGWAIGIADKKGMWIEKWVYVGRVGVERYWQVDWVREGDQWRKIREKVREEEGWWVEHSSSSSSDSDSSSESDSSSDSEESGSWESRDGEGESEDSYRVKDSYGEEESCGEGEDTSEEGESSGEGESEEESSSSSGEGEDEEEEEVCMEGVHGEEVREEGMIGDLRREDMDEEMDDDMESTGDVDCEGESDSGSGEGEGESEGNSDEGECEWEGECECEWEDEEEESETESESEYSDDSWQYPSDFEGIRTDYMTYVTEEEEEINKRILKEFMKEQEELEERFDESTALFVGMSSNVTASKDSINVIEPNLLQPKKKEFDKERFMIKLRLVSETITNKAQNLKEISYYNENTKFGKAMRMISNLDTSTKSLNSLAKELKEILMTVKLVSKETSVHKLWRKMAKSVFERIKQAFSQPKPKSK